MMYEALDIAKAIIDKCTVDNQPISNLQLQKILYYVQKRFLDEGKVLFNDDFEAWKFGPVIPTVYYYYCGFGASPIRLKYSMHLDPDTVNIMNPVINAKRALKPWDLVEDTHKAGKAWAEVYKNGSGSHKIINKELIRQKG